MSTEQAVEQTVEVPLNWDVMTLMRYNASHDQNFKVRYSISDKAFNTRKMCPLLSILRTFYQHINTI